MAEFGPNGAVLDTRPQPVRAYGSGDERPKIRRVLLATFLCGICASISVALIALALAFGFSSLTALFGATPSEFGERNDFLSGAFMAVMMSGFNWLVFYIVLPVTWVVLYLSIGLFPRRRIMRPAPYYRWGAIWGGILVGLPTSLLGVGNGAETLAGALSTGLAIGIAAGLVCAALFRAIVRPEQQVATIATDVF